jgi:hypothetical protein
MEVAGQSSLAMPTAYIRRINMIRRLKALGLAAVVVLALSAVVVSTASAANFTASKYPTAMTTTSSNANDDFSLGEAGKVECHLHLHIAAISGPTLGLTLFPTWTNCTAFGFLNATVSMNECDEEIYVPTGYAIVCPAEKKMTVVAGTCEVQIGGQTGLSSVALSNSGTGISMKANVSGIAYTVTKDGFGCPFSGTGAKTGGTYTQNNAVLISSTNGATVDIG